jgi:hypothetical protein
VGKAVILADNTAGGFFDADNMSGRGGNNGE